MPTVAPVRQAIVGHWVNDQGGIIDFYADGTGLIPAVKGESEDIPAAAFKYSLNDDEHLKIVLGKNEEMVVEIKLEGDKMTWRNPATGTDYVYTKQKIGHDGVALIR